MQRLHKMNFEADLDNIFFTDFAIDVTLRFQDTRKEDVAIKAIFEDPYAAARLGSYKVVSANPTLLAKDTPDVNGLSSGDTCIIGNKTYLVEGTPHFDGTGVTRIMLIDETNTDNASEFFEEY